MGAAGGGNSGLPGKLSPWIALGVTIASLITGWLAVDNGWFTRNKSRQCHMNGSVTSSFGAPAAGVRLGYRPDDGSTDFVQLTRSGADGKFSSSCEQARHGTSGSSFALLAKGNFRGGSLPCLGAPENTNVSVDREGETRDLSVEIRGC